MEREQAVRLTQNLLKKMVEKEGSDLFITCGFPPAIKVDGSVHKATDTPLTADQSAMMVRSIMNDKQVKEFDATKECNFAIAPQGIGRFRVSAFIQQGMVGAVLRTITTEIPTLEGLNLPPILKDVVMNKRGLVIVVGGTGSGKSTTLAAMIGHRNKHSKGHIISIEDPVEYVHPHEGCVITQREVGVDTETWHAALKNTLRQAPDVIMIGEIRDRETMEYGIQFSETARPDNQLFPGGAAHAVAHGLVPEHQGVRFAAPGSTRDRYRSHCSDGNNAQFATDRRPDIQGRGRAHQGDHGQVDASRHADL